MMRHQTPACKPATFYFHSAQCSTSVTAAPLNRRNIFNAIQGNLRNAWNATINATLAQLTKCMQQTSKCKKYDVMERIQPRPKTSLLASTAHQGDSYFQKFLNLQLCMFPPCSHCFTGFKTHFVSSDRSSYSDSVLLLVRQGNFFRF